MCVRLEKKGGVGKKLLEGKKKDVMCGVVWIESMKAFYSKMRRVSERKNWKLMRVVEMFGF